LIKKIFSKYFELAFWVAALIALAASDPASTSHFTLCPLKLAGITWCPGCGMGHSLAYLLHGDIKNSFHQHWLGVPALIVIVYRIYTLGRAAITHPIIFSSLRVKRGSNI
jgi:hypothetical protein